MILLTSGEKTSGENCRAGSGTYKTCGREQQTEDRQTNNSKYKSCMGMLNCLIESLTV